VIHPLDDVLEQKLYHADLGTMKMTAAVRFSLVLLRCYLAAMVLLVFWRVLSDL
jgi:hypothetical protein